MIFEHAENTAKQGTIGLARCISTLTQLGFNIAIPLNDSNSYDLIVERDGVLQTVQVKTSSYKRKSGIYTVVLQSSRANTSIRKLKKLAKCDLLYILTSDEREFLIPWEELTAHTVTTLGPKYDKFRIQMEDNRLDQESVSKTDGG